MTKGAKKGVNDPEAVHGVGHDQVTFVAHSLELAALAEDVFEGWLRNGQRVPRWVLAAWFREAARSLVVGTVVPVRPTFYAWRRYRDGDEPGWWMLARERPIPTEWERDGTHVLEVVPLFEEVGGGSERVAGTVAEVVL